MVAAFFAAGTVKGILGMGLPTMAIGFMTLVLDPRLAISLIVLPMVVLNIWQVWRSGETWNAMRRYAPFAVALMVGVAVLVATSATAPPQVIYGFMGGAILLFVTTNALPLGFKIADQNDRFSQIGFGAIAGIIGGITALWAPPMAMYLAARGVGKDEFVRATGLLIFLGSLPLAAGYALQGLLTAQVTITSLGLLIPAMAGFTAGESIRHKISETAFRRVLLFAFFLMGLNLLRRAIW